MPVSSRGGFFSDLRILWHMAVTGGRGRTHEERLENFYSGQAEGYDAFRKRLLHGREDLFASLPSVPGGGGWKNVTPVHHDATRFVPPEGSADVVTCSYSLTMIPDWFAAIDQAHRILKPGGTLGVVDFFVARKWPAEGLAKHGWSTRTLWQAWFANDNVFLSPDHIPYLQNRFETVSLYQHRGKVPYLPFVRAPYYQFVGQKKASA
jgi:S-adenosylmethionine-diacylgycerolhomoserine-N-methlytransferase